MRRLYTRTRGNENLSEWMNNRGARILGFRPPIVIPIPVDFIKICSLEGKKKARDGEKSLFAKRFESLEIEKSGEDESGDLERIGNHHH
jgi:endonuclease YncB( thermonuclease family)